MNSQHTWKVTGSDELRDKYGTTLPVTVVRELGKDERDTEVGPMYDIVLPDGIKEVAFSDELDPEPISATLHLVINQVGDGFWEEI